MTDIDQESKIRPYDTGWLAEVLALAAILFFAARFGLLLDMPGGHISPLWPPSGIAFAVVLLRGHRVWPAILLGSFAANIWEFNDSQMSLATELSRSVIFGIGASLAALFGRYLLLKVIGGRNPLERVKDVVTFLFLGGMVSCLISSTIGATSLFLMGYQTSAKFGQTWLTWWLGDTAGVFIVAPLLFVWSGIKFPRLAARLAEGFVCFGLLLAVTYFVFVEHGAPIFINRPLAFVLLPFIVWPAIRFGTLGAAVASGLIATLAVWGTINGSGPFGNHSPNEALLLLEIFLSIVALTALCIAAMVTERNKAEATQKKMVVDLESNVLKRTASLAASEKQAQKNLAEAERSRGALLSILEDETEIKSALIKSEANAKTLFESASDAIIVSDDRGRLTDVNEEACRMFRYERGEMLTLSLKTLVEADEIPKLISVQNRLVFGVIDTSLWNFVRKDGTRFIAESRGTILPDGRLIGVVRDMTKRLKAEMDLQEKEYFLTESQRIANVGSWRVDLLTGKNYWSDEIYRIYGLSPGEAEPNVATFRELIYPEDRRKVWTWGTKCVAGGDHGELIFRSVRPDGTIRHIRALGELQYTPDGKPSYILGSAHDITERLESENKLRESEANSRTIIESATDAIIVTDSKGKLLEVNAETCRMFGYDRDEILGMSKADLLAPESIRQLKHLLGRLKQGKVYSSIWQCRRKDGTVFRGEGKRTILPDGRILGILRDDSERFEAETKLRLSEERYRSLVEANPDLMLVIDRYGVFTDFDNLAGFILIAPLEEIIGRRVDEVLPLELARQTLELTNQALLSSEVQTLAYQVETKNGKSHFEARAVKRGENEILIIIRDITSSVEAHEKLAEQTERSSTLLSTTLDGFILADLTGKIVDVNPAYCTLSGFSRNELLAKSISEVEGVLTPEQIEARLINFAKSGNDRFETVHIAKNDTRIDLDVSMALLKTKSGPLVAAFVRDITERVEAQIERERLLESERQARLVAEILGEANIAITKDLELENILTELLDHLRLLVPYDSANVLLWSDESHLTVHVLRGYKKFTNAENTKSITFDVRDHPVFSPILEGKRSIIVSDSREFPGWERPPGAEHVISWLGIPLIAGGQIVGIYSVDKSTPGFFTEEHLRLAEALSSQGASAIQNALLHRSISQHAVELENRVTERTSELGLLNKELEAFSYSISHDLRAPLRHINGFSQALIAEYSDKIDEKGKGYLNHLSEASMEMAQLIDDVLELARVARTKMNKERFNLSELAVSIVDQLQTEQPDRIVEFAIDKELFAYGDRRLLGIVLTNLFENALKFTSKKKRAKIAFGIDTSKNKRGFFVRDNGAGFDMAYADKLFGAFQRMHSPHEFEGTGIGLASVQRIINRHGGSISAEAVVNKGATFYFSIPHKSIREKELSGK